MRPLIPLRKELKAIIVDGAGTTFDPGSKIPALALQKAFSTRRKDFSMAHIMAYMGRPKKLHVRLLLEDYYREKGEMVGGGQLKSEVNAVYEIFKDQLYAAAAFTEEIPGVLDSLNRLKKAGYQVLLTTGYNRKMTRKTRQALPWLDGIMGAFITNSHVKSGRPAPYMIFRALEKAGLVPGEVIKIGDTKVDVEAADQAGIPGILVLSGSFNGPADAEAVNRELDREHLIHRDLTETVDKILSGELVKQLDAGG